METANNVLSIINTIMIVIISVAFTPQLIFVFLCWVKPKKYPEAKTKHKFCFVVPCHNEESVIYHSMKELLDTLDYDKSLYEVYVIAHNCTDNTAEEAKKAGVNVLICDDPKITNKGQNMQFFFDYYLRKHPHGCEAFIILDADTLPKHDFLDKMNNAFDSGCQLATCYMNAKNYTQSIASSIWSIWYIRDSRFTCHVRSAFNWCNVYGGHGMMISYKEIAENGWNATSNVEDAEYSLRKAYEGKTVEYVSDAMVYDEHPATIKDIFYRNMRIGHGLSRLFFKNGFKLIWYSIKKLSLTYIDLFLTFLFIPIALMAITWFPFYYIYAIVVGYIGFTPGMEWIALGLPDPNFTAMMVGIILGFCFIVPFIIQGILVVALEHKKIIHKKPFDLIPSIIFLPAFMIIYTIAIALGVLLPRVKWRHIKKKGIHDATTKSIN